MITALHCMKSRTTEQPSKPLPWLVYLANENHGFGPIPHSASMILNQVAMPRSTSSNRPIECQHAPALYHKCRSRNVASSHPPLKPSEDRFKTKSPAAQGERDPRLCLADARAHSRTRNGANLLCLPVFMLIVCIFSVHSPCFTVIVSV